MESKPKNVKKATRSRYIPRSTKPSHPKIDSQCREATPEILRIEIDTIFKDFLDDPEQIEFIFPADLNNLQRKYIHNKAQLMNLTSKSYGKEPDRHLHIKKKKQQLPNKMFRLDISSEAHKVLDVYLTTTSSRLIRDNVALRRRDVPKSNFMMMSSMLSVPPKTKTTYELIELQRHLPIWEQKAAIINTINQNQITIITSETGSGKTTQVPQYIMEEMTLNLMPCKIICTQPRRISALSAAERIAFERSEKLGHTVGYHIKLEQLYGIKTNLIFCTTGILLRNLMNTWNNFENITHIIIDEIHERDKLSDFLLICLKQALPKYPNLKIILMSATVNASRFSEYFGSGAILSIPGRQYAIESIFLEQILYLTNYRNFRMNANSSQPQKELISIIQPYDASNSNCVAMGEDMSYVDWALDEYMNFTENYDYKIDYEEATAQLLMLFCSEDVPVDYQHSKHGKTALMIATLLGDKEFISRLCNMGANMDLCDQEGKSAFDYGIQNPDIFSLLRYIKDKREMPTRTDLEGEMRQLLRSYDTNASEDAIDFELIVALITLIHHSNQSGSILVFLPGYDDIMICNDVITSSPMDPTTYRIFFLHGSMDMRDQHEVFKPMSGQRKFILSTNIAETSITIEDVVYVIDCGKAKEKCFDSYNKVSSLQVQWISKACAKQRMGRAGRTQPGMCFRLYSKQRYESLEDEKIPEMLRVPLEELCLHSKILAPRAMNIHDFLKMAPDPPSANSVHVAIENLQFLGALDRDENLTLLGEYLGRLTIEPHLGKILLYGVLFRCIEPILTIVACMSYKDPFQMPAQANLKSKGAERRKLLLEDIMSDHCLYIKIFKAWQKCTATGNVMEFCRNFFISQPNMVFILDTRRQLLAQLRALNFIHQSSSLEPYNTFSNSWAIVKAVLSTGLYPNIAYPLNGNLATRRERKVTISHGSSCANKTITTWLLYDEMMKRTSKFVLRGVTPITPLTVFAVCGNEVFYPGNNQIVIDDWLNFEVRNSGLLRLRRAITNFINLGLNNPQRSYAKDDINFVKTFTSVLDIEEFEAQLAVPFNIGERPQFLYSHNDVAISRNKKNRNGTESRNARRCNGAVSKMGDNNFDASNLMRDLRLGSNNDEVPAANRLLAAIQNGTTSMPQYDQTMSPTIRFGSYPDKKIFMLIKPKEVRSIEIAFVSNKWVFAPQTEKKVLHFYSEQQKQIFFFFTVPHDQAFQGVAKFAALHIEPNGKPTAIIEWIFKTRVPYARVRDLRNPYNSNCRVYEGVDGQVIKEEIAEILYNSFEVGRVVMKQRSQTGSNYCHDQD